jgi:hypothetical protein
MFIRFRTNSHLYLDAGHEVPVQKDGAIEFLFLLSVQTTEFVWLSYARLAYEADNSRAG